MHTRVYVCWVYVCVCMCVSKIDVVFIHRPALYWRGRAFMSGAMIDRCNANSAHHRAFITSPPPSSAPFMKSLHPTYAKSRYASHAYFSLDNLVIYHPWRSRDRFPMNKGISASLRQFLFSLFHSEKIFLFFLKIHSLCSFSLKYIF